MLWINEGFVLDAAGKLVATSYFDLRNKVTERLCLGCRGPYCFWPAR